MSRAKGTANLAASLEVLAGAPLDAREKVPTKADLYLAANFPYPYVGLETYVVSENKKYRLIGNDVTVEANWQEVGSGGGGGTTVIANPEGPATDNLGKLQVGNDIYSIPEENVEISKAQFDALPAETKNNGKAYYIPDANILTNFTVMGNRFDKANIYDTAERMVGRWIDGKPLYQRSYVLEHAVALSTSDYTRVFTSPENVDKQISVNISNPLVYNVTVYPKADDIGMFATLYSAKTLPANSVITIQYTKTTDASIAVGTENDYSTDEMIIGTWIDGKPVYQLTYALPSTVSIGASSWTAFSGISTADWDLVISAACIKYPGVTYPIGGSRMGPNNTFEAKAALAGAEADILIIQYTKTTD